MTATTMDVSSRTPEGTPNRCAICGKALRLEPSPDSGDATCPHCGSLLWFPGELPNADRDAVEHTKRQVRQGVEQLATLANSAIDPNQLFQGLLHGVVHMLVARGGAVWTKKDAGPTFSHGIGIGKHGIDEHLLYEPSHGHLLRQVFDSGDPLLAPANQVVRFASPGGNPTDSLVLACPIKNHDKSVAVVEVFHRTDVRLATQRGYLRFLAQMCELASDSPAIGRVKPELQ